jgi:hypothetical protein
MSGEGAMTSEVKIAANRRNAQRSTGPRAALAKARVRRNALKHGLAALVLADPNAVAEVDCTAVAIRGSETDGLEEEQARIIAESQVTLKRVRRIRTQVLAQPPNSSSIEQLLRLERYEDRALSQRKRAIRRALP